MIYIYSGKIHTGKTSKLINWADGKKNIAGVLCPVIENKRFFIFYPLREKYRLEIDSSDKEEVIHCGNYKFRQLIFDKANEFLKTAVNGNFEWIAIDEAGYLELSDSGLHQSINTAVEIFSQKSATLNLIIVVRDTLVNSVIEKYNIRDTAKVITDVSGL